MKINSLFSIINANVGADVKKPLYTIIRTILKSRKELKLKNDVSDLYVNMDLVTEKLSAIKDIDLYLDLIFTFPEVQEYLHDTGMLSEDEGDEESDEEDDEEDETSDDDSESDTSDKEIALAENITVNVHMPFSWVLAITMVASVTNCILLVTQTVNSIQGKS